MESVPRLAEEACGLASQMLQRQGSVELGVGWGLKADLSAQPCHFPARDVAHTHAWGRDRPACLGPCVTRLPACAREERQLDKRPSPALCLSSFLSIHHSFPFPFTLAKKRKGKTS